MLAVFHKSCVSSLRNGSIWQASCVRWVACVCSRGTRLLWPPTVLPWATWTIARAPWYPWPLVKGTQRHPWASFWTAFCRWWCAIMRRAIRSALTSKTWWGWSSVQLSIPCCSTNSKTASADSLMPRVRWDSLSWRLIKPCDIFISWLDVTCIKCHRYLCLSAHLFRCQLMRPTHNL